MEEKVKAIVEKWQECGLEYSVFAMQDIADLFKPKRIVFEYVGDRLPKAGEYFFVAGRIEFAPFDYKDCKYPIYRVVEGAEHLK